MFNLGTFWVLHRIETSQSMLQKVQCVSVLTCEVYYCTMRSSPVNKERTIYHEFANVKREANMITLYLIKSQHTLSARQPSAHFLFQRVCVTCLFQSYCHSHLHIHAKCTQISLKTIYILKTSQDGK